jgi:hypothetical protein
VLHIVSLQCHCRVAELLLSFTLPRAQSSLSTGNGEARKNLPRNDDQNKVGCLCLLHNSIAVHARVCNG